METIKKFINFKPKVICEIGVFMPDSIHCKEFINDDTSIILVEANPKCAEELKKIYNKNNIKIFNKAICDHVGKIKLYNRWDNPDPSAFIDTIPYSPSIINDNYNKNIANIILCDGITFDLIDPGNIDILLLDIEGAEWLALKHMVSKPKLITVEMYGQSYVNPYSKEIKEWMSKNNYIEIYKGNNDIFYLLNENI